ncbi:MAG: hypothetical protein H7263_12540 [Candidatus Sericytochromatia bacterium]|nr:hypothetical protein [Candidatus Sericytochromatia bacterium]
MKSKIITSLFTIILVSISSSSCSNNHIFGCDSTTTNPSVPLQDLLAFPDKVDIEGNKFELEIPNYISRDSGGGSVSSIPFIKASGDCLRFNINVISKANNVRLPSTYTVESFWFINDKDVWEKSLRNYSAQSTIDIDGGPKWSGTGLYGVVKIIDNKGKTFFIKSGKVDISLIF